MSRAAALARLFALATLLVALGAPDIDAKPRKKDTSSEHHSKRKRKKSSKKKSTRHDKHASRAKPETEAAPAMTPPADSTADASEPTEDLPTDESTTEVDALSTEVEANDLASQIDALDGPSNDELAHLHIRDPKAVGDAFPNLHHWIHPVVRAEVLDAKFPGGGFGAARRGVPKSRGCGGHCGVDLHAVRGRPIVAVAAGILVRVDRRRGGGDGLSGRHIRIRHADGTFTTYMHLDSIVAGLDSGDHVSAGQQLGTLGSTGVRSGVAHLHFELEIPKKQDHANGDHQRGFTRWIDAAPFLRQSRVIDHAIRKRARKPSS